MTTRLTDNERTLLSAYRDGELSASERAQADGLLASSSEAREYLGDLRSLAEYSQTAYPSAASISATGAGFGSKLSSTAIQSAARNAGRTSMTAGWGIAGLAAAAVATVAILSTDIGGGTDIGSSADDPRPAAASSSGAPSALVSGASLDVDSSSLMVPAITQAELIDFAVTGRLPIDSSRERYVTVAQQSGALAIRMHDAPASLTPSLGQFRLRAVPGLDSLERAIRTSLLQSDGNGLAVSMDLPSLRLGVIEALQEASDELPMNATRQELDREYQRLSSELRQSRLDGRRQRSGGVRYVVVAGSELQKSAERSAYTWTFAANDARDRAVELSSDDRGSLEAMVSTPRAIAAAEPPARMAQPQRVLTRRPVTRARSNKVAAAPVAVDSSAISFEQVREMQMNGQTLDGVYRATEPWLHRIEQMLDQAERIRERIELIRTQRLRNTSADSMDVPDEIDPVHQVDEEQ